MKKLICLAWFLCALVMGRTALAYDWYVSTLTGNDTTGTGSVAAPFATISKVNTLRAANTLTLAAGDRLLLEGTFETATIDGLDGVTITGWGSGYEFRGARRPVSWSVVSGNVYATTITLGGGESVVSVVVDWDTSLNANGLHFGHLSPGTYASLGTNEWAVSGSTLRVNLGGTNPGSVVTEYCVGGINGLTISNATNCTIKQFVGNLYPDGSAGKGYAFFGYGVGNTLLIDEINDTGYHAAGWVGGYCSYNVIAPDPGGRGRIAGMVDGNIPLVFYTAQNSQVGNTARDLEIVASPLLLRTGPGNRISTSYSIGGCYSHTDGARTFDGVEWRNIRVWYPYTVGVNSTPFQAGNTTVPSDGNEADYTLYGARFIDCRVYGAGAPGINLNDSVAFRHCSLRFDGSGTKAQTTGTFYSTASGTKRKMLFDDCEIMSNIDGASTGRIFRTWSKERIILLNCSIAETGTGTNERAFFMPVGESVSIKARQCVFSIASSAASFRRFFYGDSWANTANTEGYVPRDFLDCSVARIATGQYSSNADYNTAAEWDGSDGVAPVGVDAGFADTTKQHLASNPFVEPVFAGQPVSNLRLKTTSALWTYRDTGTALHGDLGINKKQWTGTLGAYQLNSSAQTYPTALTGPPRHVTRPAYYIECFTGSFTDNSLGINPSLADDPGAFFSTAFAAARTAGYTHVMIHVPEGTLNGEAYYQLLGPYSAAPLVRDYLLYDLVREAKAMDFVEITLYMGAVWRTGITDSSKQPPIADPSWEDAELDMSLLPALEAGYTAVFFDAVCNRANDSNGSVIAVDYAELAGYVYDQLTLAPGGEAIPLNPGQTDFDSTYIGMGSWLIVDSLLSSLTNVEDQDVPDGASIHDIFSGTLDRPAVQRRLDQGYIVGVDNSVSAADALWVLQSHTNPTTNNPPVYHWRRSLNYRLPGRRRWKKKPVKLGCSARPVFVTE